MYDESQSFFARFSGFFLFIIALLVVGFLVFLTVRSASDDNGQADLAITTSQDASETTKDKSKDSKDKDSASQSATVESEDTTASDSEGVVVAADDDIGLTSASTDESATDSDTVESTVASDTDETTVAADADSSTVLASTGANSTVLDDDLPNTGPAENIMAVAVLGLLVGLGYNYSRSSREFTSSILGK